MYRGIQHGDISHLVSVSRYLLYRLDSISEQITCWLAKEDRDKICHGVFTSPHGVLKICRRVDHVCRMPNCCINWKSIVVNARFVFACNMVYFASDQECEASDSPLFLLQARSLFSGTPTSWSFCFNSLPENRKVRERALHWAGRVPSRIFPAG